MQSKRQTSSYLKTRFREIGIQPNARFGQNFLIDLNLIDVLVNAAAIDSNDVVLEVGTGTGSLTGKLAKRAKHVITVEIDKQLSQLAQEELIEATNITFLTNDALRNKNNLSNELLDTIREALDVEPRPGFKLVANLPYCVATPVISNLLMSEFMPDSITVTIQKELADRLIAVPSTKDYGSLSVIVQSLCFAQIVRELPPSVFWPQPKVNSAIIQLILDRQKLDRISDLSFFHHFVRRLFLHRRKFLRSGLVGAWKGELTKQDIDELMAAMELGPNSRAEELTIEQILKLSDLCQEKLKQAEA